MATPKTTAAGAAAAAPAAILTTTPQPTRAYLTVAVDEASDV